MNQRPLDEGQLVKASEEDEIDKETYTSASRFIIRSKNKKPDDIENFSKISLNESELVNLTGNAETNKGACNGASIFRFGRSKINKPDDKGNFSKSQFNIDKLQNKPGHADINKGSTTTVSRSLQRTFSISGKNIISGNISNNFYERPAKIGRYENENGLGDGNENGTINNRATITGTGILRRRRCIVEPILGPSNISEKSGNLGYSVELKSNFTKFRIGTSKCFFIYDTVFSVMSMTLKSKLDMIMKITMSTKTTGAFCFDGRRLFTNIRWENSKYFVKGENMRLTFISSFEENSEDYYQMVNVLFNNMQVMRGQGRIENAYFLSVNIKKSEVSKNFGPKYFEMEDFKVLGGFATTLQRGTTREGAMTTLLYIERIFCVLNEKTLYDYLNGTNIDQMIGRVIITKYNKKTYRISAMKNMSIMDEFEIGERSLTYAQYFKERYNIILKFNNQPFVIIKVKGSVRRLHVKEEDALAVDEKSVFISIPSELCNLCGLSDQDYENNPYLKKDLSSVLKREPREILHDIPDYCDWVKTGQASAGLITKWDLKIDNFPLKIKGRVLPTVKVMSNNEQINNNISDDWRLGQVKFEIPSDIERNIDVIIVDKSEYNYTKFINDVKIALNDMKIKARIGPSVTCEQKEIEKYLDDSYNAQGKLNRIALVFVPNDATYARVKRFTISHGLLTQCVTTRSGTLKSDERRKMVSSKTVMQIFAKFGYEPWTVKFKIRPTMIVGMDMYHNKSSKKSIHASVFSINSTFTQYRSFVNAPKERQEFHETFGKNFALALVDFKKRYDILPLRIMIYRNGVKDSQLEFTKNFEVNDMKQIILDYYQQDNHSVPQILYIIVKKSVGIKLFKENKNPNPGTIVDKEIVKPNLYEFYLVSQRITKGTATPTNYNVLEDTGLLSKNTTFDPMPPNDLQKFTYVLTHLYFNWMGSIRVPAPVHYAHRLAALMCNAYQDADLPIINERISNRLFYL